MLFPLRNLISFRLTGSFFTCCVFDVTLRFPIILIATMCLCPFASVLGVQNWMWILWVRKIQWQYHFPVSGNSSSINVAQGFIIFLENIVEEYWSSHQLKSLNLFFTQTTYQWGFSILYFCRIIKTNQNKRKEDDKVIFRS